MNQKDFSDAYLLLLTHLEAMKHPQLKWLADAAMARLVAMEPKPEVKEVPTIIEPKDEKGPPKDEKGPGRPKEVDDFIKEQEAKAASVERRA